MTRSRSKRLLRTTDLTLATYLIYLQFEAELVEEDGEVKVGHPQGAWEFVETPRLTLLVEKFSSGKAQVEPQQFHTLLNRTRRTMFDFLGIG